MDSWGADFLAGVDSSGQALAVAPVVGQLDRVLMVTHAATEKLTEDEVFKKGIKQVFRICSPTYQDGNAAAFVAKDLPAKTWATINPKYRVRLHNLDHVQGNPRKTEAGSPVCR